MNKYNIISGPLNEYMELAIEKLEGSKRRVTSREISDLANLTNRWNTDLKDIIYGKMIADLAVKPFYLAVAEWFNPVSELTKKYLKEMRELGMFLKDRKYI